MLRDIKEKKSFLLLILIIIFNLSFADSFSVEPEEFLEDKKMEIRARQISKNIRCMICQNQSIDESNATIAKDLRILIREKIKEGYKDKDIYNFLTETFIYFKINTVKIKIYLNCKRLKQRNNTNNIYLLLFIVK